MSPSMIWPSPAAMSSAVASPAVPRMPRAKVLDGASGSVVPSATAPAMVSICAGTWPSRTVIASTNACGPEAATCCA